MWRRQLCLPVRAVWRRQEEEESGPDCPKGGSLFPLQPGPKPRSGYPRMKGVRCFEVRGFVPSAIALAGVAAVTWGSLWFGQSFAFTGFLQLVVVVLATMHGGFWQGTVVSVVAAACLNYFFVPPIFSFVNSPANWVALG